MSIIADALKKAERASSARARDKSAEPKKETKPEEKKTSFFSRGIFPAVLLFLLAVSALFYFLSRDLEKNETMPFAEPQDIRRVRPAAETVAKEELSPAPALPYISLAEVNKAIQLSGIMYTPEKPLAVINNSVWGEGDFVDKFKISEIGKDFLKVVSGSQEFTVKLKR